MADSDVVKVWLWSLTTGTETVIGNVTFGPPFEGTDLLFVMFFKVRDQFLISPVLTEIKVKRNFYNKIEGSFDTTNVKVEDADMPLPLVKSKTEGYYEYGDMSVTVGDRKITTPEEFLAIGESAETLKKQYVLEADLDFRTLPSGEFAVSGTFSGELNGNGYSISGLDAALSEEMDGASVTDLTITCLNLTADTQKGALAKEIRNSTVEKIRVKNLVIENDANQAGGLVGIISGSEVRKIFVEDISIRANNTIDGIIGDPQSGSAAVESSVSLSTGTNARRISGWDVLGITSSAYVLETSDSISSMNKTNSDWIFSLTEEQNREPAFYMETLG